MKISNVSRIFILFILLIISIGLFVACGDKGNNSSTPQTNNGPYTITVEGGYINGDVSLTSSTFESGTEITLTAVIPDGQEFDAWYVNNKSYNKNSKCVVKVLTNRNFVAKFKEKEKVKYTVTIEGGYLNDDSTISTKEFLEGDEISFTAVVPEGQVFTKWTIGADILSKDNPYAGYIVNRTVKIKANFRGIDEEPEEESICELNVVGGVILSESQQNLTKATFNNSTTVTVSATIDENKNFIGWYEYGRLIETRTNYSFVIRYSRNLEARFEDKPYYSISVKNGSIDTDYKVMQDTEVTFTANESTDRLVFDRWEITCGGEKVSLKNKASIVQKISVTGDIKAIAYYNTMILVSAYVKGEATPFVNKYIQYGVGTLTVKAVEYKGQTFDNWTEEDGTYISSSNSIIIDSKTDDYKVYANYIDVAAGQSKISVSLGTIYGSYNSGIYSNPKGSECIVDQNTPVYIKPTRSDANVKYSYYSGDGKEERELSEANGYKFIPQEKKYEVECISFVPLTMSNCRCLDEIENNMVQVGKSYRFVENITDSTKAFAEWQVNDAASIGIANEVDGVHYFTYKVKDNETATNVKLIVENKYTVTVIDGTIEGVYLYETVNGSKVTLVADELENKRFKHWQCDGRIVSTEKSVQVTIINNVTYEAIFEDIIQLTYGDGIDVEVLIPSNVIKNDNGTIFLIKGTQITIKSNSGTAFTGWYLIYSNKKDAIFTKDTTIISNKNCYTFTLQDSVRIILMSPNEYKIETYNEDNLGQVSQKGKNFVNGDIITIQTKDDFNDIKFAYWEIGSEKITQNPYSVVVNGCNVYAVAVYKKIVSLTIKNADAKNSETIKKYLEGDTVTIKSNSVDEHLVFSYWVDESNNKYYVNEYEFIINKDTILSAAFNSLLKVTIINGIINENDQYGGKTIGYYLPNTTIKVYGELGNHYLIDGWYLDSSKRSSTQSSLLKIGTNDTTFEFKTIKMAQVTIKRFLDGIEQSENQIEYFNPKYEANVIPNEIDGYELDYIVDENGNEIHANMYTPEVSAGTEITIEAYYVKVYEVTIINGDGYGITSSNTIETIRAGSNYTVTMGTTSDYRSGSFIGWYIGDNKVSTSTSYTISNVSNDVTIEAKFNMLYSQTDGVGYQTSLSNIVNNTSFVDVTGMFVIPGLANGENIVVQGIDYDEDHNWAFVCGYVSPSNKYSLTNSVVFVLDMNCTMTASDNTQYKGKLIKEILLRETNSVSAYTGHAGGIAVTSKYLWICNSASGRTGNGYLSGISLETIINSKSTAFISFEEKIETPVNASYVTYVASTYNGNIPDNTTGTIYVGEFEYASGDYNTHSSHHNSSDTELTAWTVAYDINETGDSNYSKTGFKNSALNHNSPDSYTAATPEYVLWHIQKIQGMTVAGNKIVLSQSYGRRNSSYLYVYNNPKSNPNISSDGMVSVNGTNSSVPYYILSSATSGVQCASMTEDIAVIKENNNYYVMVAAESGSYKYYGAESSVALYPTDIVYKVKISQ